MKKDDILFYVLLVVTIVLWAIIIHQNKILMSKVYEIGYYLSRKIGYVLSCLDELVE